MHLNLNKNYTKKIEGNYNYKRYAIVACHVLWREIAYYSSLSPHVYDYFLLEQGLHRILPQCLSERLQKKTK